MQEDVTNERERELNQAKSEVNCLREINHDAFHNQIPKLERELNEAKRVAVELGKETHRLSQELKDANSLLSFQSMHKNAELIKERDKLRAENERLKEILRLEEEHRLAVEQVRDGLQAKYEVLREVAKAADELCGTTCNKDYWPFRCLITTLANAKQKGAMP